MTWIKTADRLPEQRKLVMTRSEYGAEIPLYRNCVTWYIKSTVEGADTGVIYIPIEWKEL